MLHTSPIAMAVLGGFFWFLRTTTPFQNSNFFLALETRLDSERIILQSSKFHMHTKNPII